MITNNICKSIVSSAFGRRLRATSPGARTGLDLNEPATSRKWRPSPPPAAGDAISVIDCIFRKDGTGSFDGTGTTWGTAKYLELYMLADNDEYGKSKTGICFVGGVEYNFVVTTMAQPFFGPTWDEPGTWNDALYWSETKTSTEFLLTVDSDSLLIDNSPVYIG